MSSDAGAAAARAFIEAELEPFDDGFVPSACADGMRMPTRLLRPPQPKALRRGLTVLPEAISEEAAHAAYDFTVARTGEERQWGTYFRLVGGGDGATGLQLEARGVEPEVERIAQRLLTDFWQNGAADLIAPDLQHVHGFSVWAVVGGVGLETAYHVDYAEVYRRRTNVIIPPVHAATLQVSPVAPADVEGGTFGAHSGGLDHYRKLGYKCRLAASPAPPGQPTFDWGQAASPVGTCGGGEGGGCWEFAPYAFRQATLCCGELPHAADRVVRWPASHCRVVVGINSMGFVEGPTEMSTCGALGPQHSNEFRMMLKLQMLASKVGGPEQVAKRLIEHVRKKRALKAAASAELGCGEQRCGEHTRTLDEGDMAGNPVRRQVV